MLRALRRRGWVLMVTLLVAAGCAWAVAHVRGTTYTAESTAVVADSGRARAGVLTPDQATQLATTYSVLIPKDTAFLQSMATGLGTSVSEVRARFTVSNTPGTALLILDYRGRTADEAIAGATAALDGITGDRPVTPNITPNSLGAVQTPTTASASRDVAVLVALGVIVGGALGLLLIVAWERVDPRIDRPEDLAQEVGSPTSPLSEISEGGASALVARWHALAESAPMTIALVPVTPDVEADASRVALTFRSARGSLNGTVGEPHRWDQTRPRVGGGGVLVQPNGNGSPKVITCAVPSADLAALTSIMACDVVVLVARRGTPRVTVRELQESLLEFGVSPRWAILVDSTPAGRVAVPEAR